MTRARLVTGTSTGVRGRSLLHPLHGGGDDPAGLGRRLVLVGMHPRALLADVGHLALEGVEAGLRRRGAEGRLVELRRAGGDHDAGEVVLLDRLREDLLPRRRAEVRVVGGEDRARDALGELRHFPGAHRAPDVLPAVTDENADPGHDSGSLSAGFRSPDSWAPYDFSYAAHPASNARRFISSVPAGTEA